MRPASKLAGRRDGRDRDRQDGHWRGKGLGMGEGFFADFRCKEQSNPISSRAPNCGMTVRYAHSHLL